MDLDALHLFVDVVRAGSFAAVARARGVATSSVSRAIAALEDELGARLFQRDSRRVVPTPAALRFFERIEPLAGELEAARDLVTEREGPPRGAVRLTAPLTFAHARLVPHLPAIAERLPEVRLELLLGDRITDLVDERIDLAVRLGRLGDSSLVATRLCAMTYVCCASPAYLARRGHPETPEALRAHACLRYPVPGQPARWRFRPRVEAGAGEAAAVDVAIDGPLVVTSGAALARCAVDGMGIVMLPSWNVDDALADGRLVPVLAAYECTASAFDLAAWLLYPSRAHLPRAVRAVAELLKARLRDPPARGVV